MRPSRCIGVGRGSLASTGVKPRATGRSSSTRGDGSGAVADASDDSHPIIERTEEFEGRVWSVVRDRVGLVTRGDARDVIIHPGRSRSSRSTMKIGFC